MKRGPLAIALLFGLVACGGGSKGFGSDGTETPTPAPGGNNGGGGGGGGSGSGDNLGQVGEQKLPDEVYGHSPDTLYKLDPVTKAVTVVGKFQGCSQIIDIAIDESNNIFGTTQSSLWAIDRTTAKCTLLADGGYPNSLSFVPKGTLDPNEEALVGYDGSTYIRIDKKNGQIQNVGSIGGGFTSSGDIVSVKGGSTYLTVKGTGCADCLIEVDPKTGAMVKNLGKVSHDDVFGLAFWAGQLYGFDNSGELFEISLQGGTVKTTPIAIPGSPAGLQFWGAGSTTSAPLVAR